jgi:hypothetical protein
MHRACRLPGGMHFKGALILAVRIADRVGLANILDGHI